MPDCNIRNIDASLLRALKVEAAKQGVTLRDLVLKVLAEAVGWHGETPVGGSGVQREPAEVRQVCAGCGWEMQEAGYCPNCKRFNPGEEKPKAKRKMTAEQFMELSPSDQMRAKREGKF